MISSALFSYSLIDMLATSDSRIILADSSGSGAAALFVLTEDAAAFSSGLAFFLLVIPLSILYKSITRATDFASSTF